MSDDAYSALLRLRYRNPDVALREIAAELKQIGRECPPASQDPRARGLFLMMLARVIDPEDKVPRGWPKLVVKHSGAGAPKAEPDNRLELFVWAHVIVLGEKEEAVFATAKEALGAGRTKASEALAAARVKVARDDPLYRDFADDVRDMHDRGVLDHVLVSLGSESA